MKGSPLLFERRPGKLISDYLFSEEEDGVLDLSDDNSSKMVFEVIRPLFILNPLIN